MKSGVALSLACLAWGCSAEKPPSEQPAPAAQAAAVVPGTLSLVKDINMRAAGSSPGAFVESSGFVYFGAIGPQGPALYRTGADAAPGGVELVKAFPSAQGAPVALGSYVPPGNREGVLLFKVFLPSTGSELWLSDGTEAGTSLLKDLNPGSPTADPQFIGIARGFAFIGATRSSDFVLWRTDGTAAGTQQVSHRALRKGAVVFRDQVVFPSGVNDAELWITDGTEAGTRKIKEIHPTGSAAPTGLVVAGNTLFFLASDGVHGNEPWKTDGTEAGTVLVKDVRPGSSGSAPAFGNELRVAAIGTQAFFAADDGVHGLELWKTDGTEAGTVLVKDGLPGSTGSNPFRLRAAGNKVFFTARPGTTGLEPWVSDGTEAGTFLLQDIYAGEASSNVTEFHPYGQGVVFAATDALHGRELWASDGSVPGTARVAELFAGVGSTLDLGGLSIAGGHIYFSAATATSAGEPGISDGTAAGTRILQDLQPGTASSAPSGILISGARAFFSADDGETGRELYVTDGTAAGTARITDLDQGPLDGVRGAFTEVGGSVFFPGYTPEDGTELWVYQGKALSAFQVRDINPLPGQGGFDGVPSPGAGAALGSNLYFAANDGVSGVELWTSNGTARGTYRVVDLVPGVESGLDAAYVLPFVYGKALYFSGFNGARTLPALFRLSEGESVPVPITPDGVYVTKWVEYQGKLFFLATGIMGGPPVPAGLWSTEGTLASTQHRVSGSFRDLAVVGTELALVGDGAVLASNGTPAGTRLVALVGPGPLSRPLSFGGHLIFSGGNGTLGFGLWSSDLTRAGTLRLNSLEPDISAWLGQVGGRLYFNGAESKYGNELWRSDLTVAGTTVAFDINPGPQGSNPRGLSPLGPGRTLLIADDGVHGAELWHISEVLE
jgi:ELWxxDGT repeat protein